jgi:toxin ParE1/3/4
MPFEVLLTEDARRDIEDIYKYIADRDSRARANHVLDQIENVIRSLERFPQRGSYPRELLALGIREYRQAFFKPYRLIYRVIDEHVYVYMVADGRRDMQTLLARRMLGGEAGA